MDGRSDWATRFTMTLRSQLFQEHFGLLPPQLRRGDTPAMRPTPRPNDEETSTRADQPVANSLADSSALTRRHGAKEPRDIHGDIPAGIHDFGAGLEKGLLGLAHGSTSCKLFSE